MSKVTATCDSAHSWQLYRDERQGHQYHDLIIPNYSDIILTLEPTSPCPILTLPSTRLGSDKHKSLKSLISLDQSLNPLVPKWEMDALLIWPSSLVISFYQCMVCIFLPRDKLQLTWFESMCIGVAGITEVDLEVGVTIHVVRCQC